MRPDRLLGHAFLTALVVMGAPSDVRGQGPHLLRFHPRPGTRVHMISRSEIRMGVTPGEGARLDTIVVEGTRLESVTRSVLALNGRRASLELSYDSIRARVRPVGGLWRDVEPTEGEIGTVRLLVNERLEVMGAESTGAPHLVTSPTEMARGLGVGFHLSFPDRSVAVADSWNVEFGFPLGPLAVVGAQEGVPGRGELRGLGMAVLDSLVARSRDTLLYISVRARFPEQDLTKQRSDIQVTARGSLAAVLIWSSAWNAYVSGATRLRVVMSVLSDPSRRSLTSRLQFDINTQSQVRM